jgi:hypothetical protein
MSGVNLDVHRKLWNGFWVIVKKGIRYSMCFIRIVYVCWNFDEIIRTWTLWRKTRRISAIAGSFWTARRKK